jgi:hypothetical protein
MNFKNSQWRHDGTKAPWETKQSIYFVDKVSLKNGVVINSQGIFQI